MGHIIYCPLLSLIFHSMKQITFLGSTEAELESYPLLADLYLSISIESACSILKRLRLPVLSRLAVLGGLCTRRSLLNPITPMTPFIERLLETLEELGSTVHEVRLLNGWETGQSQADHIELLSSQLWTAEDLVIGTKPPEMIAWHRAPKDYSLRGEIYGFALGGKDLHQNTHRGNGLPEQLRGPKIRRIFPDSI